MQRKNLVEKDKPIFAIQFSADDIWSFADELLRRELGYEYDMENPNYIVVMVGWRKIILIHNWWLVFYGSMVEALDTESLWYQYEER